MFENHFAIHCESEDFSNQCDAFYECIRDYD